MVNKFMVICMIASLFLIFVALGVAFASLLYGVGGIFPLLVALSLATVFLRVVFGAADRPAEDAQ